VGTLPCASIETRQPPGGFVDAGDFTASVGSEDLPFLANVPLPRRLNLFEMAPCLQDIALLWVSW
jgi:hypothetical protein